MTIYPTIPLMVPLLWYIYGGCVIGLCPNECEDGTVVMVVYVPVRYRENTVNKV